MSLWGVLFLGAAFLVLLTVVAVLSLRRAEPAAAVDEAPAEPFSLFRGSWWLLHWLPYRFEPAGVVVGLLFGALSWALLLPRAGWASGVAVLTMIVGGEYCGEGVWQALSKHRWRRFAVGTLGSLLCLSAMGLHFGLALGSELPFPFPEWP